MDDAFLDRLVPVLSRGDLVAGYELLHDLAGDELAGARKCFLEKRRWFRELYEHVTFEGDDHDETLRIRRNASWIVAMSAVKLCGPRTAAERVPWVGGWGRTTDDGEAAFVHLLWDEPADWVAEFVDAASRVRLGTRARAANATVARVLRAAATHHRLPCPSGATFLKVWWSGTPLMGSLQTLRPGPELLVEWLAVDPLMPDLLMHYLASGESGDMPWLPAAVGTLAGRGKVDRDAVVDLALQLLTAGHRPRSQRVLASIVAELGVRPEEVPGGLTYLLGVLATCDRTVLNELMPLTLATVEDGDDYRQLAELVAGRPEKKPKRAMLTALRRRDTVDRIGPTALIEALGVLGAGDDAGFSADVDTALAALGAETGRQEAGRTEQLGLWTLDPQPSKPVPDWPDHVSWANEWRLALGTGARDVMTGADGPVDQELAAMARGTFDAGVLTRVAIDLLAKQRLSPVAVAEALEAMFLAGGLRHTWSAALAIADAAAGAATKPPGLADLLRVLARYAVEVPEPQALPLNLAALASDTSRTKAATEARRLAEALRSHATVPEQAAPPPERRGLWDAMTVPDDPLPSSVRVPEPDPLLAQGETLAGLRDLLAEVFAAHSTAISASWLPPRSSQSPRRFGLSAPERVLAAAAWAIRRHGADPVRRALEGLEPASRPIDVVGAVDLWAADRLDHRVFWRVAFGPVSSTGALFRDYRDRFDDGGEKARARIASLPSLAARLHLPDDEEVGALLLPDDLAKPLPRFAFLGATEILLRAPEEPVVLSAPTWEDGTLDLQDLLTRLRLVAAGTGTVGPLDLVRSLHRLRDVDPVRVDDVPRGLRTDPAFTSPEGRESWDATDLVQRWIASGGLPALEPVAKDGRWTSAAVTPVPFGSLAAWPAELADDPFTPGTTADTVRLLPRWADRAVDEAFSRHSAAELPSLAAGPYGVPIHDRLLAMQGTVFNRGDFWGLPYLVRLAQRAQLDPEAAAAAAVGRHEAGTLGLRLLTSTFQRAFEEALPALWPVALAIADALCAAPKKPTSLADLLRLLTLVAHEVPAHAASVPPGVQALAEGRGSTKAHQSARDLVTALRRAATA